MMYLDEVVDQIGDKSRNFAPLVAMIKNSKVVHNLRNHGYTIVGFSTGYGISELRDADVYMEPAGWRPSGYLNALWNLSPLTPLTAFRKMKDSFYRELILHTFDHLADATEIESPTFVFAHVLAPHWPYVFGANGESVDSKPDDEYEYTELLEAYRNQVAFVNKRVLAVIEEILARSSEPPIIILQADHGVYSRHYEYASRMAILNAYYFPDQDYKTLYEDITPVNTFRVIFDRYFGTDFEMLEDRSYFFEYLQSPYSFVDVTDKVLAGD